MCASTCMAMSQVDGWYEFMSGDERCEGDDAIGRTPLADVQREHRCGGRKGPLARQHRRGLCGVRCELGELSVATLGEPDVCKVPGVVGPRVGISNRLAELEHSAAATSASSNRPAFMSRPTAIASTMN